MNIVYINPCRPFAGMARLSDFQEMLVDALARAFGLNTLARCLVDEAVHHAYQKHEVVIMRDIISEVWELRTRFGEPLAFEICAAMNCMVDDSYGEFSIFCEKDGVAMNELDIDQLKGLYRATSNRNARAFIENMILYALLF